MSGFDDNPFGEPTVDNPFAVRNVITSMKKNEKLTKKNKI